MKDLFDTSLRLCLFLFFAFLPGSIMLFVFKSGSQNVFLVYATFGIFYLPTIADLFYTAGKKK